MRWNWMGQLFGQSLQHGANWKGMSAAGAEQLPVVVLVMLMLMLRMLRMLRMLLMLLLLHPILQFSGPHGRAAMGERREPLGLAIHGSGLACEAAWPAWAAAQAREA